jgi:hypothetical protein
VPEPGLELVELGLELVELGLELVELGLLLELLLQAATSNAAAVTPARTTGYRMGMGTRCPSRAFTTTYLPRWRNLTLARSRAAWPRSVRGKKRIL